MTKTELLLLERIIDTAITKAVTEAVSGLKKEIKDLKLLNAKVIQESKNNKETGFVQIKKANPSSLTNALNENRNEYVVTKTTEDIIPSVNQYKISATMANQYAQVGNESLPDIDAPIFFNPDSDIMREIKEKFK